MRIRGLGNRTNIKQLLILFMMCGVILLPFTLYMPSVCAQYSTGDSEITIGNPFAICHGYGSNDEDAADLANQGVQTTRNDITWSAIEKTNGTYDFSNYDQFYGNITAHNIQILAILDYGNANIYGSRFANHITKEQVPHWLDFVNITINRYKTIPNIAFEIWNEPNLNGFWNGTDEEFFYLLNATAILIHDIAPTITLCAPGISGNDPDYLERMITYIGDSEFNTLFDVLCYHPYSGSNAELITTRAREVKEVTKDHNFMGEIWITEVGISTPSSSVERWNDEYSVKWTYQATQVLKTFVQALSENLSRIVWYCYRDSFPNNPIDGEANFGIQHKINESSAFEYKPAGFTYQMLSHLLTNSKYDPNQIQMSNPTLIKESLVWRYSFQSAKNTTVVILWTQSIPIQISLQPQLTGSNQDAGYKIVQYNYIDNTTSTITNLQNHFTIDFTPILLEIEYNSSLLAVPTIRIIINISGQSSMFFYIISIPSLLGISVILFLIKRNR